MKERRNKEVERERGKGLKRRRERRKELNGRREKEAVLVHVRVGGEGLKRQMGVRIEK